MRLFIAIELPDKIKRKLAGLRRDIPGVRWVPQEQLHLTLLFLGELEEERLELLCTALERIAAVPFNLRLTRPGCFPRAGNPRVLWFGVDAQPALERLAQRVKTAVASCGIAVEERPFCAHITLARIRQPAAVELKDYTAHPAAIKFPPLAVREFVLLESRLTRQGAQHLLLRVFSCTIPT